MKNEQYPQADHGQICKLLNCTKEQLSAQFRRNAEGLVEMADKAIKTGKKFNGYRAGQLVMMAIKADANAERAIKIKETENRLLVAITAKKLVPCNSLAEASALCRAYTDEHAPGYRKWTGGAVYHPTKKQIALIVYNGRIFLKGLHPEGSIMTSWDNGQPFGKECDPQTAQLTTDYL